ncbi:MAG: nuclear transport factor 2 family protein [Pseudomonadota bacterium]
MAHARSLEGMLDRLDLTELIHAYCFHFDRAEADAVVALFTEDAVIDYGPDVQPLHGTPAFGPMIRRGLEDLFAATSHHVSNVSITLQDPDVASSVSYVYAWHRYRQSGEESELWGQYHHAFRRMPEGWKISGLVLKATGTRNFHRQTMHPIGRRLPGGVG